MLGEFLGEVSGKGTLTKVEAPEAVPPRVHMALQGRGTLLGTDISDFGSYWQKVTAGGRLYGEGQSILATVDGDTAVLRGFGTGHFTGVGTSVRYAVAGSITTDSQKLARLDTISTVAEYEIDDEGNYRWKLWEWLPGE